MKTNNLTSDELAKKKKNDLVDIARAMNLKGYSKLKKDELIKLILSSGKTAKVSSASSTVQKGKTKELIKESLDKTQLESAPSSIQKHGQAVEEGILVEEIYIPHRYNETRITAMVKDPEWVYTYWDIEQNLVDNLELRNRRLAVRVYDVTEVSFDGGNAHYFFDIDVTVDSGSWFIKIPESNRNYCLDIGYFDSEGRFQTLARSNIVSVPRNGVSDVYDERWMVVEELFHLSGGHGGRQIAGSFEIEQLLAERMKLALSSDSLQSSWSLPTSANM